ncbi:MAG: PAS domain S-box protein [Chloroflexi bacterium]|nr:PAS domain S-box protein [Chloroflexota bacterium]
MEANRRVTKQNNGAKSKTQGTRKPSASKPILKKIVRNHKRTASPQIENILERVSDGFVAFDADMNYTYVNTRGGEMLGRKPADLIGKNYWTEYPEAKGSTFANAYLRALKEQAPLEIEDYYEPFDRWFENRIYPSKDGLSIFFHDITDRKRAEEALQRNEQVLRLFVEHSPAAIAMFDRDMNYIVASRRYLVDYDLGNQNVIGRSHYEIFPEIPEHWKEIHRRCLAGAIEKADEDPFPRLSGKMDWIRWEIRPWSEANGEIGGVILFSEVITERKQAEEEMALQNKLLNQMGYLARVGAWKLDVLTMKQKWSDETYSIHEVDKNTYDPNVEKEISRFIPKDEPILRKAVEDAVKFGKPYDLDLEMVTGKGNHKNVRAIANAEIIDGKTKTVYGAILDITERRRAEKELRESEERFFKAFHEAPIGMSISDLAQGVFTEVNQTHAKNLGFTREEMIGHDAVELGMRPASPVRELLAKELTEQGNVRDREYRLRRKDGEIRDFLVNAQIITIGESQFILAMSTDITESKRAERERDLLDRVRGIVENELDLGTILRRVVESTKETFSYSHVSLYLLSGEALVLQHQVGYAQVLEEIPLTQGIAGRVARTGEPVFLKDTRSDPAYFTAIEGIVSEICVPIFDEGKVIGIFSVENAQETRLTESDLKLIMVLIQDISPAIGRARIHTRLRESEQKFSVLFEKSAFVAALSKLPEGVLVNVNEAFEKTIGFTREEAIGKTSQELGFNPDAEGRARILALLNANGSVRNAELPLHTKSGEKRNFSVNIDLVDVGDQKFILNTMQDITERKRAEEELRLSRDRLGELSRRLLETHETVQRAIGRELHDQIGQMLTALKLTMEIMPQLPPELAAKKMAQSGELVNDLLSRVSALSLELRPPMLDDLGLIPALTWHVNRFQGQTGIEVDFKHSGVEGVRFSSEIETTAYRAVQEALTNVARHAEATRTELEVRAANGMLNVQIEDNGKGFDPQVEMAKHRSSGLRGIRERASLVDGTFQIESQPGKGTKKIIQIPLPKEIL